MLVSMLQPTALALLRTTFPVSKLNAAIGGWGAVIGASTAAGPIVGGLLVQHIGWESCFYVNVPVGAAALIMSLRHRRQRPGTAGRRHHPHQPCHVHGGNAQRFPGRRRRRTRRSRHRPDHQTRHRHRRSAGRHLTPASPESTAFTAPEFEKETPMKSLLSSRQVLWFLFLFNLVVAVAAGFALYGTQQLLTSAGMGVVSLGAGASLFLRRSKRA
jgi:Major Facilitator Superfamily